MDDIRSAPQTLGEKSPDNDEVAQEGDRERECDVWILTPPLSSCLPESSGLLQGARNISTSWSPAVRPRTMGKPRILMVPLGPRAKGPIMATFTNHLQ